ncbi:TetR/AcrR family transcriptional regulator [Mangrovimonas aestuarii]|uniref:TetR/AcrR family transcriptional regulator n=1 Tax=Mangrovimonas aestuarii TaxID=3018443 RepID=UPI002378BA4D|nr:TetR/AcrR family transcriptional regulator [Mangrovimonas aestuarii]
MKEKILQHASEMFLTYGFKSVTMDDIANGIGISKKTIYQHFDNKTKLVEATTNYIMDNISCGIDQICEMDKNPIEEIFEIKKFVANNLKDEKSSPAHQLQKYYPKIFKTIKEKQFEKMKECVIHNLNRGLEKQLYRDSIQVEFISRLYFNNMMALKDNDLYPQTQFSIKFLMENYLEYHLRGICTPKGLETLNQILINNKSEEEKIS